MQQLLAPACGNSRKEQHSVLFVLVHQARLLILGGRLLSRAVRCVCCVCLQESWADQIRDAGFKAVTYENLTGGVVAIHSGFKL